VIERPALRSHQRDLVDDKRRPRINVLIDKSANVNAPNDAGMTAMHDGAARPRSDHRVPDQQGARFDMKNTQGKTLADRARGRLPHASTNSRGSKAARA
jgi:hypothetical protein